MKITVTQVTEIEVDDLAQQPFLSEVEKNGLPINEQFLRYFKATVIESKLMAYKCDIDNLIVKPNI